MEGSAGNMAQNHSAYIELLSFIAEHVCRHKLHQTATTIVAGMSNDVAKATVSFIEEASLELLPMSKFRDPHHHVSRSELHHLEQFGGNMRALCDAFLADQPTSFDQICATLKTQLNECDEHLAIKFTALVRYWKREKAKTQAHETSKKMAPTTAFDATHAHPPDYGYEHFEPAITARCDETQRKQLNPQYRAATEHPPMAGHYDRTDHYPQNIVSRPETPQPQPASNFNHQDETTWAMVRDYSRDLGAFNGPATEVDHPYTATPTIRGHGICENLAMMYHPYKSTPMTRGRAVYANAATEVDAYAPTPMVRGRADFENTATEPHPTKSTAMVRGRADYVSPTTTQHTNARTNSLASFSYAKKNYAKSLEMRKRHERLALKLVPPNLAYEQDKKTWDADELPLLTNNNPTGRARGDAVSEGSPFNCSSDLGNAPRSLAGPPDLAMPTAGRARAMAISKKHESRELATSVGTRQKRQQCEMHEQHEQREPQHSRQRRQLSTPVAAPYVCPTLEQRDLEQGLERQVPSPAATLQQRQEHQLFDPILVQQQRLGSTFVPEQRQDHQLLDPVVSRHQRLVLEAQDYGVDTSEGVLISHPPSFPDGLLDWNDNTNANNFVDDDHADENDDDFDEMEDIVATSHARVVDDVVKAPGQTGGDGFEDSDDAAWTFV